MAYIRKHKDKWRAQVERHGTRASHVADTKREAQAWALKKELELDALKGSKGETLGSAVEKYLSTASKEKGSESAAWERRRFDAFMVYFPAETKIASVTTARLGEWRDWRLEGDEKRRPVSGATVLREINLMRHMFSLARDEWKWITTSPFTGLRMPEDSESRHQLWRWQDIRRVLRADRDGKTAEVIAAFRIALHTALRLSEIIGGRYDPAKRVFVLYRSKGDGKKRVEVPVPRRAAKLFPAPAFTVGANEASTLFCVLTDQLLIDDLTFHDSRATALTLLSRRMDVMTLARISRHKNLNILMDTYYRERSEDIAARI
jgi:integrase